MESETIVHVRQKTGAGFVRHMFGLNWGFPLILVLASLALGMIGYHATVGLGWVDSLLNASMILTGMGPVAHIETTGGKVFASLYALYSGVVFLAVWTSFIPHTVPHVLKHFMETKKKES